jgi:dTDP-4-dehydrorhamnose reductase
VKLLIFGISGLIGSSIFKTLTSDSSFEVYGTCRNNNDKNFFKSEGKIFSGIDVYDNFTLQNLVINLNPDVIINCVGVTKHSPAINDYEKTIMVNSVWPHQLAKLSSNLGVKLIHISTDCVFSGKTGNYSESDIPDANDFYGRSKILGEVTYDDHLTLRISTIVSELRTSYGLLEWFLSQENSCKGYSRAFFSGLPTVYFAQVLLRFILPRSDLKGLYHISSKPIDKFSLLKLISLEYGKKINIDEDDTLVINRSLNSSKFSNMTGFVCSEWPNLIKIMASTNGIPKNVSR